MCDLLEHEGTPVLFAERAEAEAYGRLEAEPGAPGEGVPLSPRRARSGDAGY